MLDRMEAEGRQISQRSHAAAFELGAKRMASVGDERNAPRLRERRELWPVARLAGVIDSDDRLRPRTYPLRDALGIQEQRARVHVGKDRGGPFVNNRVHGGRERHRRDDDLVAWADPQRPHRRVKRCGSRRHGDGVLRTDIVREGSFESVDRGPRGEPIATQHRDDGRNVVVIDALPAVGDHGTSTPASTRSFLISSGPIR